MRIQPSAMLTTGLTSEFDFFMGWILAQLRTPRHVPTEGTATRFAFVVEGETLCTGRGGTNHPCDLPPTSGSGLRPPHKTLLSQHPFLIPARLSPCIGSCE